MRGRVVGLLLLAVFCVAGYAQECPDISECAKDVTNLRKELKDKGETLSKLEELVQQLKGDLAAANSKRAEAESQLSAAQEDAKSAQSKLTKLQGELSTTSTSLETTRSKLARAEGDLAAAKSAADAGSSCKVSLQRAESRISEQASRLEELKAIEEALLPLWLSRRLIQAQTWTAEQWKELKESDMAAQAAAKVAPYYNQAAATVGPYWEQALEVTKPARETAGVYFKQAKEAYDKLPIAEAVESARKQVSVIEGELQQTLKAFIATQPSLSGLNDPVILQLLVYTVMGLPLLLLVVVLLTLVGGPRKAGPGAAAAQPKAKKNSGGGGSKEAAPAVGRPAAKAAQGQPRKGKATRVA